MKVNFAQYLLHKVSLALHPSGITKSSINFGWVQGTKVTTAE